MVTMVASGDGDDGDDDDGGGDCELQSIWPMLSGRIRLPQFFDDRDNCGD